MKTFEKNSRVIFTGDSITAQTKYTARIIDYYRKHLPELNVKFFAGAESGGTLANAIRFFEKNVLPFSPTHATVCFGVNDCRVWALTYGDEKEKRRLLNEAYGNYKTNLNTYLDMLSEHGITPILITPVPYAEHMKIDSPASKGGHKLVEAYADVMRTAAKERGLELVDLFASFADCYEKEELYGSDRIHPNDLGQYRMAEFILKAQGLEPDPYIPLNELLSESYTAAWQKTAYRFCRIYGAFTCVFGEIFDKSYEEQMEFINEYVLDHKYGTNEVQRDFSTELAVLLPREKELINKLIELSEVN